MPIKALAITLLAAALAAHGDAQAQASPAPKRPLMQKYAGSPNSEGLLREPAVRSQLDALVGKQMPRLIANLDVRSDVDLIVGALAISGNAPHKATEEEAIVCVADFGPTPLVEAAIFSKGKVTVFAKAAQYEYLMPCVKNWITEVNNHRDRMTQPKNVQLISKP